ncbi:unnamed protein product [Rotaria sp. Silwood1]|nr:unnamed protein product [Rotaria sp. Silwood1]
MIPTNSRSEAIDACLKCSQSAMQLLRRKKIRRDILMQYLARKSIPVGAGTDKVCKNKNKILAFIYCFLV